MKYTIVISLCALLGSIVLAADQNKEGHGIIRIHNLYVDEKGDSHFRDINVDAESEGPGGKVSKRFPATGIIFRTTSSAYNYDWHTAPRRQYIINLDAAVRITASDGESRVIGPGEIFLVEDTQGKGHVSQAVDGKFRHSVFVTLD
jgi:hypothetical protein